MTTGTTPRPMAGGMALAVVVAASLAVLGAGEPTTGGGGGGNVKMYNSATSLRSTSLSSSIAQSGTMVDSASASVDAPAAPAPMDLFSDTEKTTAPPEEKTTEPPDEATTTPVPPQTPSSILLGMKSSLADQLYRSHHQWVNAMLAFIFGVVMVFDGEHFFKWLVIASAFLLAAVLAMSEASELWAFGKEGQMRHLVGLEVGALGAYAALLGIEGVMIIIGAILGFGVAFSAQGMLVSWGLTSLATNKWIIVVFYSLFTAGFVAIFKRKKHVRGLAVLSAAIGGALVSSAMSWFVTDLAAHGYMDFLASAFQGLTPADGAWIDFFLLLWSSSASDKGLFADSSYNFTISNQEYHLDRILGCSFWLLLFAAGAVVQLRALKARVAEARGPRPGPLREALLPGEE